jgi:hypothetical protein
VITGIIGGIQGASASHNAANSISNAYGNASTTVNNATNAQNPLITGTAQTAGANVVGAAGTAGTNAVNTAATGAGNITGAGAQTVAGAGSTIAALNPYSSAGATAAGGLNAAANYQPFNSSMMESQDPGYQFTAQQGGLALQRQEAAGGTLSSGGASEAMAQYSQNTANQQYQQAFNNYTTGHQNLFSNLSTVAGMGQQATEVGGQQQLQANQANIGAQTSAAGLAENASQYQGNQNVGAATYAGNTAIGAQDLASANSLGAAQFTANSQIGSGKAIAAGDIGASNSWNSMLGGIGSAGNSIASMGIGGFLPGQTPGYGWGSNG